MLDPKVIEQLVQEQVASLVNKQVEEALSSDTWLAPIEQKIIQYTQDHLLRKFSNAAVVPEIVDAVKEGITELFVSGKIPNLQEFINPSTVESSVNQAVEQLLESSITKLTQNTAWLNRVEDKINQAVTYQTITKLSSIDINTIIRDRVDENVDRFVEKLKEDFSSVGIIDQATRNQMTIMDEATVFENNLVARDLEIADGAIINNLVVKGSINTDNVAWDSLAADIKEKTLKQFADELYNNMVKDISEYIKTSGIDSQHINYEGQTLAKGNSLAGSITQTNIQKLGILESLTVRGGATVNDTLNVLSKRVGINTEEPEMALSVWDEEVTLNIGKNKLNQAYIGTSRAQGIAIGINRVPQIEIDANGMTQIKKLRVGVHQISHSTDVPGWAATRGDIVFNSNPKDDRVFAWVCLGNYKWQPLKSAE